MEKKVSTRKKSVKKVKSPAKTAKKKTEKKGDKKTYVYEKLADLIKGEKSRVNTYAIVLDSSAPYYMPAISRYLCTMKLIDDSLNPKEATGKKPAFMHVTFFSKEKSHVPQHAKMGAIIRIHRGDVKKYEKEFRLNCDKDIKGAWALFDSAEGALPIAHTGKSYTFTDDDKKRLKDIRAFSNKFFKEHDVTKVSSTGAKKGEVDMFCQVLSVKTKDKTHSKITVFDGEKFHEMDIVKDNFPHLAPKDIVLIRGIVKKGDKITFEDYSNVIKVDHGFAAAKAVLEKIEKAKKSKDIKAKYEKHLD